MSTIQQIPSWYNTPLEPVERLLSEAKTAQKLGNTEKMKQFLEEAVSLTKQIQQPSWQSCAAFSVVKRLDKSGDTQRAEQVALSTLYPKVHSYIVRKHIIMNREEAALRFKEQLTDRRCQCEALYTIVDQYVKSDEIKEAQRFADSFLQTPDLDPLLHDHTLSLLVCGYLERGQVDTAVGLLPQYKTDVAKIEDMEKIIDWYLQKERMPDATGLARQLPDSAEVLKVIKDGYIRNKLLPALDAFNRDYAQRTAESFQIKWPLEVELLDLSKMPVVVI